MNSSRCHQPRRRFRPSVESLEDRQLPVFSVFDISGTTLLMTVNPATTQGIKIEDDGSNNPGNIKVIFAGGAQAGSLQDKFIDTIEYTGSPRTDTITYDLKGNLRGGSRRFTFNLGGTKDKLTLNLNGHSLERQFFVAGAGSQFRVDTNGGAEKDTINYNLGGGTISAGSQLTANVNGGGADDIINSSYNGKLDGTLFQDCRGGGGPDRIDVRISPGLFSAGVVGPVSVRGGGEDDILTLFVDVPLGFDPGLVIGNINGNGDSDTCNSRGNVTRTSC